MSEPLAPEPGGPPAAVAPNPAATRSEDLEHLKLLSIFHYVAAGLLALLSLLPLFHLIAGLTMIQWTVHTPQDLFPGLLAGGCLAMLAGIWMLIGFSSAACLAAAGRFLARREHHTFCLAVAGVACLFMPVGTILGVFTILVLVRPSVRALFPPPAFPSL
jgi:amino acid transporter